MEQGIRIRMLILLWLLMSGVSSIQAQSYYTLPDSNATWIMAEKYNPATFFHEFGLNPFQDDTLINSNTYHKIYLKHEGWSPEYAGAYRSESDGKTYFVSAFPNDTNEYLLFDFSADVNDTINDIVVHGPLYAPLGAFDVVVDSIKNKLSGQYNLKCLYLSPIPPFPPYYDGNPLIWVEKIGCLNGGIFNYWECGLYLWTLRCMSADDTTFYFSTSLNCFFSEGFDLTYEQGSCEIPVSIAESESHYSTLETYPNPFTTSTTIEYELKEISNIQFTIYNVIGEVVYMTEDRMMPQGKHSFTWTADRLPKGLYYAVLRSEEGVSVIKIIKQ